MPQDPRFIPDDPRFVPDEIEVKGGLESPTPTIESPSVFSDYLSKGWHAISDPLWEGPSRLGKSIADYIDNPQGEGGYGRGFLAGATQGVGDLASSLTSPINLALTALTAGSGSAAKAGLSGTSNALRTASKVAALPVIAHGGYEALRPDASLKERGFGLAEMVGGGLALKGMPKVKESIDLGGPVKLLNEDPNFNAGVGNPELAGSVPYPHAPIETNIPKVSTPPLPQAATKLLDAMKESVPLTKEQAKIYTAERGEKIGKVRDVITEGEAGYHERLGALKGEHTKVEIEPLRNKLEQTDVDELFSHIQRAPISDEFAKINASSGLSKLLAGQVPQPSELKVMNKIFGEEFTNQVSNMLPQIDRKQTLISEAVNLPRAIMSSTDFSAPLRQGLPLIARKEWWTSFDDMFKAWGSEKAFRGIMESIEAHPDFEFSQTSGLKLTDLTNLSNREEALMSTWAEKIPGVRRSNRAYVAFLDKLRSDTFHSLIKEAEGMGLDPKNNLHLSKSIADFVNTATGRGSLGRLERSTVILNNTFFSPRLIASRVKMLNPATYINAEPFVRRQYIKGLLSVAAAGSVASGLAKLAGAEVELDPRSSDFGKAKFGNVRLDPYGGFQQYIVAASRLISGESKSPVNERITDLTAGQFGRPTRVDILGRFAESKLNPAVGLAIALLRGKEVTGEPFTFPSIDSPVKNSIAQRFLPMFVQDVNDIAQEDPTLMPLVVPAMFGAGTQVFGN